MLGDTFEDGTDSPDRDGSLSVELAKNELHVEQGKGPQEQHHDVGNQECSSSILVAEVGEPPDICQIYGKPDDAQ